MEVDLIREKARATTIARFDISSGLIGFNLLAANLMSTIYENYYDDPEKDGAQMDAMFEGIMEGLRISEAMSSAPYRSNPIEEIFKKD